jgi:site-specific recombinase XerD
MQPGPHKPSPFLQSVSNFMAVRRYSKRTIKSYLYWMRHFIVFHDKQHPSDMSALEVEQFLTYLAVSRKVSVSTQKIALNALAFLYNRMLEKPLGNLGEFNRASAPPKLPHRFIAIRDDEAFAQHGGDITFGGIATVWLGVAAQ